MKKTKWLDALIALEKAQKCCKHKYVLHRHGNYPEQGFLTHVSWCLDCGAQLICTGCFPHETVQATPVTEWTVKEDAPDGEHWTSRNRRVANLFIKDCSELKTLRALWDARRARDPRG